jgi:hypothetical protein
MNEELEKIDFKSLTENETTELVNKLDGLSEIELGESLIFLIDNKVEMDSEVPASLQKIFAVEKFSTLLEKLTEDKE